MEGTDERNRTDPSPEKRDSSAQTDRKLRGHGPRLSEVNLFTLLSLWMELFHQEQPEEDGVPVRGTGLVVALNGNVVGLHCSGAELHAGQAAIIQHGARLADCQLYFSRRPCATCLKMAINAGVAQISFWPGDPEISMLTSTPSDQPSGQSHGAPERLTEEAALDAVATEKLKSNSRPPICVRLQPPAPGLLQFVDETSRECDFMEAAANEEDAGELFSREQKRHLKTLSRRFLVETSGRHRDILTRMGLENFCNEPCFSNLRGDMLELVRLLAAVAAGVPRQRYGFYREELSAPEPSPPFCHTEVSQEVARHCIIQARLLAYRTEDPKSGVGAVIWARGQSTGAAGAGRLHLMGCGYNAYPAGSQYAQYPQMDDKQEDRQRRKYRYIVHAEQNALTFRTRAFQPEETTMLFVTKCPCDECVPLICGAGIKHIYTTDQDKDRDKGDISYLRFSSLKNISKFIWRRSPSPPPPRLTNGCVQDDPGRRGNKRLSATRSHDSPT
ncbi:cytidine and dCMP deaminase domain-containing protein 1 [Brachionichthys hirsutus]|uniref:cytidine and dCMP deaminase domain-containing protein 1 n=1 Tax=Brachionichthys hirsutus TaxID=412623 RepID=UPI003604F741